MAWWLRQGAFPLPLAPTGLTAVKGDNEITISWNNPNNKSLKGYQYSVDSGDYVTIPGADRTTTSFIFAGGTLKKCVNSQAVYPLSEQDGLEAQERRYTAHEEGKH